MKFCDRTRYLFLEFYLAINGGNLPKTLCESCYKVAAKKIVDEILEEEDQYCPICHCKDNLISLKNE